MDHSEREDTEVTASERRPRLILHFDINKTLIMRDPIQDKDIAHVLNDIIAETAYGTIDQDGKWQWDGRPPADEPPPGRDISFSNFLRQRYPHSGTKEEMDSKKKLRKQLRKDFTSAGNPGEGLRIYMERLQEMLRLPENIVGTEAALEAGLDGDSYFILPALKAFFHLLLHLQKERRRFSIIFRTFGDDISKIAKEFNAFCQGSHPLFPHVRMDGSHSEFSDLRLDLTRPDRFGCFVRGQDDDAVLILGTVDHPSAWKGWDEREKNIETYFRSKASEDSYERVDGLQQIYERLESLYAQGVSLAIRDDYHYWWLRGESERAGKLFLLKSQDMAEHSIFFDDNILREDAHICDAREVSSGAHLPFSQTKDIYLVRCNPVRAIQSKEYFIELVKSCEARRAEKQS